MSAPFGQPPTYADLIQQIADLRDQLSTPLTIDDLPLGDLRSALIDNGPPLDLSVLALDPTPQIARGGVVGATGATTKGVGFTVVRTSPGVYAITFSPVFKTLPVVVAAVSNGLAGGIATTSAAASGSVTVKTFVGAAATDADFDFIASA